MNSESIVQVHSSVIRQANKERVIVPFVQRGSICPLSGSSVAEGLYLAPVIKKVPPIERL